MVHGRVVAGAGEPRGQAGVRPDGVGVRVVWVWVRHGHGHRHGERVVLVGVRGVPGVERGHEAAVRGGHGAGVALAVTGARRVVLHAPVHAPAVPVAALLLAEREHERVLGGVAALAGHVEAGVAQVVAVRSRGVVQEDSNGNSLLGPAWVQDRPGAVPRYGPDTGSGPCAAVLFLLLSSVSPPHGHGARAAAKPGPRRLARLVGSVIAIDDRV